MRTDLPMHMRRIVSTGQLYLLRSTNKVHIGVDQDRGFCLSIYNKKCNALQHYLSICISTDRAPDL